MPWNIYILNTFLTNVWIKFTKTLFLGSKSLAIKTPQLRALKLWGELDRLFYVQLQNLFLTTAFLWYNNSQGWHDKFLAGKTAQLWPHLASCMAALTAMSQLIRKKSLVTVWCKDNRTFYCTMQGIPIVTLYSY